MSIHVSYVIVITSSVIMRTVRMHKVLRRGDRKNDRVNTKHEAKTSNSKHEAKTSNNAR